MTPAIERAKQHTESKLKELRGRLVGMDLHEDYIVVTCGSYARREASTESDIDFFIITSQRPQQSSGPEVNILTLGQICPNRHTWHRANCAGCGRRLLRGRVPR